MLLDNQPRNIDRPTMRQWMKEVNRRLKLIPKGDGKTVRVKQTSGAYIISALLPKNRSTATANDSAAVPFQVGLGVDQYNNEVLTVNFGSIEMGEVSGVWPYPVDGVQAPVELLDSLMIEDGELYMKITWLPDEITVDGYTRNYKVDFSIAASANDIPLATYDVHVVKLAIITSVTNSSTTVFTVNSTYNRDVFNKWL